MAATQTPKDFIIHPLIKNIWDRGSLHRLLLKAPYIIAAILAGLTSVGFGLVIDRITETTGTWLEKWPFLFLLITPLAFVLARWIVQVLGPAAAGSGIPQVIASLHLRSREQNTTENLLNIRILLAKILSCSVCLMGGGLVGREGPMVQISAIIFLEVSRVFRRFLPKIEEYNFIVAGGAAGVAAAFNTPLGGIVFAIEELIDQHFAKVRSALIVGVIIAGMVAQSLVGPYLYFGAVQLQVPGLHFLLPVFGISLVVGILGGLFGKALIKTQLLIGAWTGRKRLIWAAGCGFGVALALIAARHHAAYAVGGGTNLVRDIIWRSQPVDAVLLAERFIGSLGSFISGCAGGIFAPSLAFGAALGKSAQVIFPSYDPVTLTLIGMTGFLAALTRAPFTSMVLVTEMTDCHGIALYVLLASLFSVGVARVVEPVSYYHFQSEYYMRS